MTRWCSRCTERPGKLFRENTPNGPELTCLAGHRWTAVPLEPLPMVSNNPSGLSKRKPNTQGITL